MDKLSDRNKGLAVVKDVFEIKSAQKSGHDPGLVVVLDRVTTDQPANLTGKIAVIRSSSGNLVHFRIDEAKDHIAATSLFFRNLVPGDVAVGSVVELPACQPNADPCQK